MAPKLRVNCDELQFKLLSEKVRITHIEGQLLKHGAACFAPTVAPKSSGGQRLRQRIPPPDVH
jgi:hypothetical protein